jgi:lysophospholipase
MSSPTLPAPFTEPENFQWGYFTNGHGAEIRYGSLTPSIPPKGTIVLLTGFREFTEKYFEVIHDLTAQGFAVWTMDWRGQGGSDRFHPQKIHSEGYDEQVQTLQQFVTHIIDKKNTPVILMAHYMGAHIGLRYLKEHNDDKIIDSAVFTAPMLDIKTHNFPKYVSRLLSIFAKVCGYQKSYVPHGTDWAEHKVPFEGNEKTSDPERFATNAAMEKIYPSAKMGDATFGFLYQTFKSVDILNEESYLKSIQTPILMQVSGDERVVERDAQERASRLLPHCTKIEIPAARHEIWMEQDSLRAPWLGQVHKFLAERAGTSLEFPNKTAQKTFKNSRDLG